LRNSRSIALGCASVGRREGSRRSPPGVFAAAKLLQKRNARDFICALMVQTFQRFVCRLKNRSAFALRFFI
jgi:hypothetical protein